MSRALNRSNPLQSLIHSMNEQEIDLLKKYLTVFASRKDEEPKTMRLLEFLVKNKEIVTDEDCALYVYEKKKDNQFEKLKSRLKQKTLHALINDINIDRNKEWDEIEVIAIKLRKRLSQYSFLSFSRPNQPMALVILDEIIGLAKTYEIYSILIEALRYKKYYLGYRFGRLYYKRLDNIISHYQKCNHEMMLAHESYIQTIVYKNFSSVSNNITFKRDLKIAFEKIKMRSKGLLSQNIRFYQLLIERFYYFLCENFRGTKIRELKMLKLVQEQPSLNRKARIGNALRYLSESEIYLGQFLAAADYAKKAKLYMQVNSLNYHLCQETEFLANLYSGNYQDALVISNNIIQSYSNDKQDFWKSKYLFYNAVALFKNKDYHLALKKLRINTSLSNDKTGWDIGIRILIIQTLIELNYIDQCSNQIESLRKHIHRTDKERKIKFRDKLILRFLVSLDRNSFNIKHTIDTEYALMRKLNGKTREFKWAYFSHELFPFQDWVFSKK